MYNPMKMLNYMNLNQHPVQLSFSKDRTHEFVEVYHAHQGMELLYVETGEGHAVVNQQIVALSPGSLVVFRPFQLHRIQMKVGSGATYIRSLFIFEPSVLDEFLKPFAALQSFFQQIWKGDAVPQVFTGLPEQAVGRLLDDYRDRLRRAPQDSLLEEQVLFLIALLQFVKFHGGADVMAMSAAASRKSTTAELVMEWIEEHYTEEFELDRLAKAVHLSPNHVSAVFKQSVGTNITEYLTARRIRQACWLLKTSDLTVQAIGQAIGLSSFPYFCQLFKKHVGVSPYRFKKSSQL
ncbi:AraC family transcriptional regulator [Paenibacillus xerothermodurans]|uniref:AraC family transcriptional regulator n=1 Tax=Paenibacillus xerothermodurans TaxID=1977292 RepID=UPI001FB3A930|nr:AraC family transcriptional regulator [Paenibacillus xerothermodurans]